LNLYFYGSTGLDNQNVTKGPGAEDMTNM